MRVRVVTLRYSPTLGGFDDTVLAELVRDKEVLDFREHFYAVNRVPHLFCVVVYQDATVDPNALARAPEMAAKGANERSGGFDNRRRSQAPSTLDERDRLLWNELREWRSERAREEGVPAYVILRDREITAIVLAKPESPTALGHVPGIGPAKVKSHGKKILSILHGTGSVRHEPSGGPEPGETRPRAEPIEERQPVHPSPAMNEESEPWRS